LRGGGPGLAPVRGAGFLFQRGVPGRAGSYRRSAAIMKRPAPGGRP